MTYNGMIMRLFALAVFSTAIAGIVGNSQASIIGDTVTAEIFLFTTLLIESDDVIVGAGPDGNWQDVIEYDLDDNNLTVRSLMDNGQQWGTGIIFSFTGLEWLPVPGKITNVTVTNATGIGWNLLDDSDVSFTASSILIDANKIGFNPVLLDQSVTIEFTTSHIPEPTVLCLAFAAFCLAVGKRQLQ